MSGSYMQIKEVVEIEADHSGEHGILTAKFLPQIKAKLDKFLFLKHEL